MQTVAYKHKYECLEHKMGVYLVQFSLIHLCLFCVWKGSVSEEEVCVCKGVRLLNKAIIFLTVEWNVSFFSERTFQVKIE